MWVPVRSRNHSLRFQNGAGGVSESVGLGVLTPLGCEELSIFVAREQAFDDVNEIVCRDVRAHQTAHVGQGAMCVRVV
jgi:hypothetical protein